MANRGINPKPTYVILIKTKEELLDGGYGMGLKLLDTHPMWCGNYRLVYRSIQGMDLVENDNRFVVFEYMFNEKLTLDEALQVCPEVMI